MRRVFQIFFLPNTFCLDTKSIQKNQENPIPRTRLPAGTDFLARARSPQILLSITKNLWKNIFHALTQDRPHGILR